MLQRRFSLPENGVAYMTISRHRAPEWQIESSHFDTGERLACCGSETQKTEKTQVREGYQPALAEQVLDGGPVDRVSPRLAFPRCRHRLGYHQEFMSSRSAEPPAALLFAEPVTAKCSSRTGSRGG